MALSRSILKNFAKVTNDRATKTNTNTYVYATAVVGDDGSKYVKMDGSNQVTPVSRLTDMEDGDRVMVSIQDHRAVVMGNLSYPPSARMTNVALDIGNQALLEVEEVRANLITTDEIRAEIASFGYMTVDEANIAYAKITELDAVYGRIDQLEAGSITTEYLDAEVAKLGYVTATQIESEYVKAEELEAKVGNFGYVKADELEAKVGTFGYVKTDELEAKVGTFGYVKTDELEAVEGKIDTLTSKSITTDNLSAKVADLGYATIDYVDAGIAEIDALFADYATINQLNALEANINEAFIGYAKVVDLEAAKADIDVLDANYANIETLLSGNVSSGSIQSIVLNSSNATIANGTIKSAMIESLTFDKITGFDINTTNLTIHSNDGKSKWSDNTIQISDANRVRVQIGKDASNDYSMSVWDASGKLIWDALGATENTIQRAIIRDNVIASDAAIAGSKLDINSVVRSLNGATETLSSTSVIFDDINQSFDASFKSMETTVANNLEQAKAYVDGEIDGLEIGGRNLLTGTSEDLIQNNINGTHNYYYDVVYRNLEQGETYTFSAEVTIEGTDDKRFEVFCYNPSGVINGASVLLTADGTRQSWTFTVTKNTPQLLCYAGVSGKTSGVKATYHHMKLEKGTKATDWTPAPEDTQNQIDELTTVTQTHSTNISVMQGQISALIAKDTEIENALGDKVTTSQYNSIKATVDSHTQTISSHTTQLNTQSGQISSVSSRVTTVEQNLDTWSAKLTSTQSDLTALTSRVKTTETSITALQGEIALKVSQTEVDEAIDGIEIGGRNYILNSGDARTTTAGSDASVASNNYKYATYYYSKLEASTKYTFSAYVEKLAGNFTKVSVYTVYKNGGYSLGTYILTPSADGKIQYSFTTPAWTGDLSGYTVLIYAGMAGATAGNSIKTWNVKVEKGTKATDWTPAPEDVDSAIDTVDAKFANYSTTSQMDSAINVSKNSILSTVSETYTTISDHNALKSRMSAAELKITKDGIVSTVGDYYATLDDINVGGRNLIRDTSDEWTALSVGQFNYCLKGLATYDSYGLSAGDTITFSVYVKTTSGKKIRARIRYSTDDGVVTDDLSADYIVNDEGRIYITVTLSSKYTKLALYIDVNLTASTHTSTTTEYVKCLKLERGNIATDWTPAPEDDLEYIADLQTEINQTKESITFLATKEELTSAIQVKADSILTTVGNNYATKSALDSTNSKVLGMNYVDVDASSYDESLWIPFVGNAKVPTKSYGTILVSNSLDSGTKPSWATHSSGFTVDFEIRDKADGWGTSTKYEPIIIQDSFSHCSSSPVSYAQATYSSTPVLYLRGGGKYRVYNNMGITAWTAYPSGYTWTSGSYSQSFPTRTSRPSPRGGKSLGVVQSIAVQTQEQFKWIVASGTSASDFTITDRMATLTANYINLNGLVTFSGLSSDAQSKINTAQTTANTANSTANSVNTTVTNNKSKWDSAYTWTNGNGTNMTNLEAMVKKWTNNAVSTSTYIQGGWIATNTITADKIAANQILSQKLTATNLTVTGDSVFEGVLNGATGVFKGTLTIEDTAGHRTTIDSGGNIRMSDLNTDSSTSTVFTIEKNDGHYIQLSPWYIQCYDSSANRTYINYTGVSVQNSNSTIYTSVAQNSITVHENGSETFIRPTYIQTGTVYEGGTALSSKYAALSHEHKYLAIKGTNTISSVASDTTNGWGSQLNGVHWYQQAGLITSQPATYGFLFNIGFGSEVHQMWFTQSGGSVYHRGGNGSGWASTWKEMLDSTNYTNYCAKASHTHSYLPLSGGTLSGHLVLGANVDLYMTYNSKNYTVVESPNNGNVLLNACGGGLYLGYSNTSEVVMRNGRILKWQNSSSTAQQVLVMNTSNQIAVGNSSYAVIIRGSTIQSNVSITVSSDRNAKHDINDISQNMLDAFMDLRFVQFRYNENNEKLNAGLIYQEAKEIFEKHGIYDFAGIQKPFKDITECTEEDIENGAHYGSIAYDQFQNIHMAVTQKHHAYITELQNGVVALNLSMTNAEQSIEQLKHQYLSQEERMQYIIQQLQQAQTEIGQLQTQLKALA